MNEKPHTFESRVESPFILKSYPKSELALLYFPNSTPHVAMNHRFISTAILS